MKITDELLKRLGACGEAREWFKQTFPNGCELTPENLARCENAQWIVWFAARTHTEFRFWCAGVAFREAAKRNPTLKKYAMNVTPKNWQEARRAAADAYAADAAAAAAPDAAAAYTAAADAAATAAAAAAAYAYAADADAYTADARERAWKEIRVEAERVLLSEKVSA